MWLNVPLLAVDFAHPRRHLLTPWPLGSGYQASSHFSLRCVLLMAEHVVLEARQTMYRGCEK